MLRDRVTPFPREHNTSPNVVQRNVPQKPLSKLDLLWRLALVLVVDAIIWTLHLSLLDETIENMNLEIDRLFNELSLIGWLFAFAPDLTSRELLAGIIALLFVGAGIAMWLQVFDNFQRFKGSIAERCIAWFIAGCYAVVIAGEYVLIESRVSAAMIGPFAPPASFKPAVAIFLSVIFIIAASAAAAITAALVHELRNKKEFSS